MSIRAIFFTTSRRDICDMSRVLASNLCADALSDRSNPVLWSNHGSHQAAKSLIAEEVSNELGVGFAQDPFRHKPHAGYSFEYPFTQTQYYDIQYPTLSAFWHKPIKQYLQKQKIQEALNAQEFGGIIFIHNAAKAAQSFNPDIEISTLSRRRLKDAFEICSCVMPTFTKRGLWRKGLLDDYQSVIENLDTKAWVRLHEVTIHNPDIFQPDFIRQLELVTAMEQGRRESKIMVEDDHFPVPFMI